MHQEAEVNPRVPPDVITYNSVMNAWARSGLPEGPEKAEGVFRRIEKRGLKPDTISFSTSILAWANSGDALAGK
jgi:hypothetical protein